MIYIEVRKIKTETIALLKDKLSIETWLDPLKIFSFAKEADPKKKESLSYNLCSLENIDNVLNNGGKYFVLLKNNIPVSIIALIRGFPMLSLDNPSKRVFNGTWFEVGAMLTKKEERRKGYSKFLFKWLLSYLDLSFVHIGLQGKGNFTKKGTLADSSIPIERLCSQIKREIVGYGIVTFGPIYRLYLE
jgi:hypothetical protein